MNLKKRNMPSSDSTYQNTTGDSKQSSIDINLQALSKTIVHVPNLSNNIYYQILFPKSAKELNRVARNYFTSKRDTLKKRAAKLSNFFVKNQEISQIYEEFSQLTAIYCYIIMSFIKNNDYPNAKNIFETFFTEFKDTFIYCHNRIGRQYPNRGSTSNIFVFYHKMILKSLKGLSCLIFLSEKLNKQQYHSFFFNLYIRYISIVKQKVDLMTTPRSEGKTRENAFFCHCLSLGSYYSLWKIRPLEPSLCLLNKITEIFKECNDQLEKTEKELMNQSIVYYNLALLYYTNDQADKALTSLSKGLDICLSMNDSSSVFTLKDVNQMFIKIYLLAIEITIDKRDFFLAMQHIRKLIALMSKYKGASDEQKRLLEVFLKQVNASLNQTNKKPSKSGKIKEFKEMLIGKQEPPNKNNHFEFEVEEIEKFCLFLSSLSMHQTKVLNDTQPVMKISTSLPICFSNQFTDCLTFSQRMSLFNIKVLTLYRFLVLKEPEKPIVLGNLNFELFALREKPTIILKDKNYNKITKSFNVNTPSNKGMAEVDRLIAMFNDKSFVNRNKELLFFLFKSMSQDFEEECIKNPLKVQERIIRCKSQLLREMSEEPNDQLLPKDQSDFYLTKPHEMCEYNQLDYSDNER